MKICDTSHGLPRLKRLLMASPSFFGLTIFSAFIGQISGAQYYLFRKTEASWEDAKAECVAHGRMLARINSAEDQTWVENLRPYVDGPFWIGLKKKDNEDKFAWLDSTTDISYSNWAEGFPGYEEGFDCVRVRSGEFQWETFNCSHEIGFLCEDIYYKRSPSVSEETKVKGVFLGLATIGGLLFLSCLLLQLPCFRYKVSEKIAHIGFGVRSSDAKLFT